MLLVTNYNNQKQKQIHPHLFNYSSSYRSNDNLSTIDRSNSNTAREGQL